jgi:hypothetical protein
VKVFGTPPTLKHKHKHRSCPRVHGQRPLAAFAALATSCKRRQKHLALASAPTTSPPLTPQGPKRTCSPYNLLKRSVQNITATRMKRTCFICVQGQQPLPAPPRPPTANSDISATTSHPGLSAEDVRAVAPGGAPANLAHQKAAFLRLMGATESVAAQDFALHCIAAACETSDEVCQHSLFQLLSRRSCGLLYCACLELWKSISQFVSPVW